ncbi:MAG: NAD(P)(+) transhydrogenase (Re/Si-specific) subunit beta [Solirubrobacterales bacterium]|nr:NAD(P)(+) transhydrogenase (Re/Si-specific) subunit beta [Solirubrobacterales bacterium]
MDFLSRIGCWGCSKQSLSPRRSHPRILRAVNHDRSSDLFFPGRELHQGLGNWGLIALGVVMGTVVGVPAARNVKMTAVPQMVALFNGVGGGAVALIAWVEFRESGGFDGFALYIVIASMFAAVIGSISFWGSNIAFGKLQELLPSKPISLGPLQQLINLLLLLIAVGLSVLICAGGSSELLIIGVLVSAGLLGIFVVLPIGGADMPVVISLLNALTGLSAAATGIALDNTALIVAGMIVGASGTILTRQMAEAMNRTIPSIVAGGFGGEVAAVAGATGADGGTVRSTTAADAAIQMAYARLVVVVPGYGMAVAQAQHAVRELSQMLELVIGANDVTNPDARKKTDSPIFGMPILNVDESESVIVLKRSMASGFAGIENPLFTNPKTAMLFGDAKASVGAITEELKAL